MTLSTTSGNEPKRKKARKGSVSVYCADDRLRLRWQAADAEGRQRRFSFAIGADTQINRIAAERLARQIELDIASGNFDPSLRKYRPEDFSQEDLGIKDLINKFINSRSNELETKSIEKYGIIRNKLEECLGDLPVEDVGETEAQKFFNLMIEQELSGETINAYLTLLRSVWKWAIKKRYANLNPWLDLKAKVAPRKRAKPFSEDEVRAILKAFEGDYYRDFIWFVLGVGCRPGEAIALNWDAVSEDCTEIWIGRSWEYKTKRLKTTKTNKERTIPVSPSVSALLKARRPENPNPEDAVFPAPRGGRIDGNRFLKRQWKPTLERLGIPYRPFNNSRHSQWTKEIVGGMDIATAAYLAGNTPRTMMARYLGPTKLPRLKDWTMPDGE